MTDNNGFGDPPVRHRADDDVEALASGSFALGSRTPNGESDLLADSLESNDRFHTTVFGEDDDFPIDPDANYDDMEIPEDLEEEDSNSTELAQRTNKIVSDYRDYLSEMDRLGEEFGEVDANGEQIEADEAQEVEGVAWLSNALQIPTGGNGILQRTWSRPEEPGGNLETIDEGDTSVWPNYPGLGSYAERYDDKNKSYRFPLFQERKFRVCVISGIVVVALFGVLIALTTGGHSSNSDSSAAVAPPPYSEPPEAPKYPSVDEAPSSDIYDRPPSLEEDDTIHNLAPNKPPKNNEPPANESPKNNEPPANESPKNNEAPANESPKNNEAPANEAPKNNGPSSQDAPVFVSQPSDHLIMHANQNQVSDYYKPIWFSRSSGWLGKTYEDGVIFCGNQAGGRFPCPYSAYCPDGPGQPPLQGVRGQKDEEQWSPMIMPDKPGMKLWVGVGPESTCLHNVDVNNPQQMTEEATQHIMCCIEPTSDEASNTSGSSNKHTETTPATNEGAGVSDSAKNEGDNGASAAGAHGGTGAPNLVTGSNGITYSPIWLTRADGWNGRTYMDAEAYCHTVFTNGEVCDYDILCPDGGGKLPYPIGLPGMPSEQWAPVKSPPNTWVRVDKDEQNEDDICQKYITLHGAQAMFGLDGDQIAIKENVLCCSIISDDSA